MDHPSTVKLQLDRIGRKLKQAKLVDQNYLLFGAKYHKYKLNPPLPEAKIEAFEGRHGIKLPCGYRKFLEILGDGGAGYAYGLYSLAKAEGRIDSESLQRECPQHPDLTDDEFNELFADGENWNDCCPCDGMLLIGYEGCTLVYGLMISGPQRGRIVHYNLDHEYAARYEEDAGFLEWYERWLDDIIEGKDMRRFSGSLAGSQKELCGRYQMVDDVMKSKILYSLSRFPIPDDETLKLYCQVIREEQSVPLFQSALSYLIEKRPDQGLALLKSLLKETGQERRELTFTPLLQVQDRQAKRDLIDTLLLELLPVVGKSVGKSFCTGLKLIQSSRGHHYQTYADFFCHPDPSCQQKAYEAAGQTADLLPNLEHYVQGLANPDPGVNQACLQSIIGLDLDNLTTYLEPYKTKLEGILTTATDSAMVLSVLRVLARSHPEMAYQTAAVLLKSADRAQQEMAIYALSDFEMLEALDTEALIPYLLKILPQILKPAVISKAFQAIMKTSYHHFQTYEHFFGHQSATFRHYAYTAAGKSPDLHKHLNSFIPGLYDPEICVYAICVRAVTEIDDERLIIPLQTIYEKSVENDGYSTRKNIRQWLKNCGWSEYTFE